MATESYVKIFFHDYINYHCIIKIEFSSKRISSTRKFTHEHRKNRLFYPLPCVLKSFNLNRTVQLNEYITEISSYPFMLSCGLRPLRHMTAR